MTDNPPLKRDAIRIFVTLTCEGRVLLRENLWNLMLSTMMGAHLPFHSLPDLEKCELTVDVEELLRRYELVVPQPPEYKEDSDS